jgi:hypothetical protein
VERFCDVQIIKEQKVMTQAFNLLKREGGAKDFLGFKNILKAE